MNELSGKTTLIVGGTGSWASGLTDLLLESGAAQVRICARGEARLVELNRQRPDGRVVYAIGDIRDKQRMLELSHGCDYIFLLAALKHVPVCETMPYEAVQTNVLGVQNIIDCAVANKVSKVVYTSTDKAVAPQCAYGCTKLLAEKLILAANKGETRFIVFRSGNLLGSSGSVIPLFARQIEQSGEVSLTDEAMSRFFISINKASELLLEASVRGAGGEIFLPKMPSLHIRDIARYMLEKSGLDKSCIRVTGLRPGEKLSELMATEAEHRQIFRVRDDLYMIEPRDRHGWVANSFVQKDEYHCSSREAVLEYEQAAGYLSAAGI